MYQSNTTFQSLSPFSIVAMYLTMEKYSKVSRKSTMSCLLLIKRSINLAMGMGNDCCFIYKSNLAHTGHLEDRVSVIHVKSNPIDTVIGRNRSSDGDNKNFLDTWFFFQNNGNGVSTFGAKQFGPSSFLGLTGRRTYFCRSFGRCFGSTCLKITDGWLFRSCAEDEDGKQQVSNEVVHYGFTVMESSKIPTAALLCQFCLSVRMMLQNDIVDRA